ncbi:MAG TPA: DHH family phosphoesterase [Anaerolineae bacterium]|nr:DHH family phosphoesterase [Anaerolineae bacterium]
MRTPLDQALERLHASQRPLLIAHPRPDGDTIGSTLALRLALLSLGKAPRVACVHPLPENLAYLPGAATFEADVPEDADIDLVVAVDMSDLSRTGGLYKPEWAGRYALLVIDHHKTNGAFGDVNLIEAEAAATAIPMARLIAGLGVPLRDDIATCLLAAIITDTRGLRTETVTPAVLRWVSELVEAGGDYLGVMQKTLDAVPYRQMRAWGIALSRLQLEDDIAWTALTLEDKAALGIEDYDDLDLGNLLAQTREAQLLASFLEMRDGTVKVSLRARPGFDVAWIAGRLGGGGHVQAAGFSFTGRLEEAQRLTLALLCEERARRRNEVGKSL